MNKAAKIIIGIGLIITSPLMIELAYMERGYWAVGGEYPAMAMMIAFGISLLWSCRKKHHKNF